MLTPTPGRARAAISAQFFTNGALTAALLPRLPEIKGHFGLDDATFGLVVAGLPLGAILAAPVGGRLVRRFGALRVATLGSVALAVLLAGAAASPWPGLFVVLLALAGACDALLDTGQNVHGLLVQRWCGRSILNSLHAVWSLGAAVGGAVSAAGAGLGVPVAAQVGASGALWATVAVVASRFARVAPARAAAVDEAAMTPVSRRRRGWVLVLGLVVLALCGALVEDVIGNWSALIVGRETGIGAGLAASTFAVALAAQCLGRFIGDPLTDRFGVARVATVGGAFVVVGGVIVALAPSAALLVTGFALAAAGSAPLVPAALAGADTLPGLRAGSGVATISGAIRAGSLVTSPLVGVLAGCAGLRVGMLVLVLAGLLAAAVAATRPPRSPH